MRVHVELPERASPGRDDVRRAATRLAVELARRGHDLSLRGGGAIPDLPGVRVLAPRQDVGAVDGLVCVDIEVLPDVTARRTVAWTHEAHWPADAGWDAAVVPSAHHARALRGRLPELPIEIVPPACDLPALDARPRDRLLCGLPPERAHLLSALWPLLWEAFRLPLAVVGDPRAAFARQRALAGPLAARVRQAENLLDQPGVVVHGPLSDAQLERIRTRGAAVLCPIDPHAEDWELSAHSLLEACAAGCAPILSPADALPSMFGEVARQVGLNGTSLDAGLWVEAVREVLADLPGRGEAARSFRRHPYLGRVRGALGSAPRRPDGAPEARPAVPAGVGGRGRTRAR